MNNQKKWISDTIERLTKGAGKFRTCKVGIIIGNAPQALISYAESKGFSIPDIRMAISDERLMHSCRDFKRDLNKKIALSDKELADIPELIKSSDIYYDPLKNNFLFIYKNKERLQKIVFTQNYKIKMNGIKNTQMIQFVTASHIKIIEKTWKKIN